MVARRCAALLVLAVGVAHGKRTLQSETVASANPFAASLKATDKAISAQIDAARDAAKATVPDLGSAASGFNAMAESMVPKDWSDKVNAAIANFKVGDAKSSDPQVKDFAKMMAGIMLLDNEGDSNIANTKLGELVKKLIDFTFNLAKVYVTAPQKIVTDLPGQLSAAVAHSQPQNFIAWFQDHKQVYEDLLGIVYKPKADGTPGSAQGTLTHPDSVDISGNFINYAPCIISNTPVGFGFGATGINIVPSLLQTAPSGFNLQPQGANIQPAFFYAFPAGFNLQPQGVNIAPTLIGVTPGGFAAVPAGGLVGGALLAATIAQPDAGPATPAAGGAAAGGDVGTAANANIGAGAGAGAGAGR